MIEILGLNWTHTFRSIVELQCLKRQTWRKTPALGKSQSKLSGYIEHSIITVNIFYCMICPTRSSQLAACNSQLATRNSQLAARNSQLHSSQITCSQFLSLPLLNCVLEFVVMYHVYCACSRTINCRLFWLYRVDTRHFWLFRAANKARSLSRNYSNRYKWRMMVSAVV